MRIVGIRADVQVSCPIFNKQLIDLMIFEVFLYLDDTINNNDDNVQEVEKNTEVCRDLFRLQLVFFIFQDASYNLRMVIYNRTAFRQRCCPNIIQSIMRSFPSLCLQLENISCLRFKEANSGLNTILNFSLMQSLHIPVTGLQVGMFFFLQYFPCNFWAPVFSHLVPKMG